MEKINKINENLYEILPTLNVLELEKIIKMSSDSYYNLGISLIDDNKYDILLERLKEINPKSVLLKEIGAPVKGKKVKLPYWMGSMDKITNSEKQINKWISKYNGDYVISNKLDGISCLLVKDGNIKLYTRGNGSEGQNITHLLNMININTDKIEDGSALRGELIMTIKNFKKYSKLMSNARNMVGGLVNSKIESINEEQVKDVDFISYEVIEPRLKASKQMELLKEWNQNVVYYDIYEDIDLNILSDILKKRKATSKYEIDGIIITNNKKYSINESGNPPYSFAFKGITETAQVEVLEVIWKASMYGTLVPRIHFSKVRLSQADLEYTSGFNAKFIKDNKIGPGSIITVIRSGEVIPYILNVIKPSKASLPIEEYKWDKNGITIELIEPNEDVIIQTLNKFIEHLGIENLSEGLLKKLVNVGYDNIFKILTITEKDLMKIEGFQKTLSKKIYENIQEGIKNIDILKVMSGTTIFGKGFGKRTIKKILNVYPNIVEDYKKGDKKEWEKRLKEIEGFDTITIDKFLNALPKFQKFFIKLNKIIEIPEYEMNKEGKFSGQNIVFTGFRNEQWEKKIEKEGGKVSNNISKNTTLLVYNDNEKSQKFNKAKELNINIIKKTEFSKKFEK